mmetsp:Transcript_45428/g.33204  ORF Transcript_45428/g.33204 Transcript_45428/m.33204 type:complete len:93 (+) Transcript_45428:89-367(+)
MNYFVADVRENTEPLNFGESNVALLFSMSDFYRSKWFVDEKYGSFYVSQVVRTAKDGEDETYLFERFNIPISRCSEDSEVLQGIDLSKLSQF